MTKFQSARFKMLGAVIVIMNSSILLWQQLTVIANIIASLTATGDLIKKQHPDQIPKAKGTTVDKNEALIALKENAFKSAINLKSIATASGDTTLANDATFTKKSFSKGGEPEILARSQFILNNLRTLETHAKAAGCGVSKLKNDELDNLITVLLPKEEDQKTAHDDSKRLSIDLKSEFKSISKNLKDLDKKMYANMADTNPDFYLQYKIARKTDKPNPVKKKKPIPVVVPV